MSKKITFADQALRLNKKIAEAMDQIAATSSAYFDNGFDSAGSDPILDTDLAERPGLTAADLSAFITLLNELNKFFEDGAVTQADYSATVNKLRYVVNN